jgi:hypothetical protein
MMRSRHPLVMPFVDDWLARDADLRMDGERAVMVPLQ